jgi:hypothetical protein
MRNGRVGLLSRAARSITKSSWLPTQDFSKEQMLGTLGRQGRRSLSRSPIHTNQQFRGGTSEADSVSTCSAHGAFVRRRVTNSRRQMLARDLVLFTSLTWLVDKVACMLQFVCIVGPGFKKYLNGQEVSQTGMGSFNCAARICW